MLDYYKIPSFLMKCVTKKYDWQKFNPELVRAYAYAGEYTDQLLEQLERVYGKESIEYKRYKRSSERQKERKNGSTTLIFLRLNWNP